MEVIHQYGTWLVLITAVFGFFMAFGIGANDVSNSMGTSVGSGTITAKQAIIIALIFESAGAYLAGGEVTETIKSGVIDPMQFTDTPDILALGMLPVLGYLSPQKWAGRFPVRTLLSAQLLVLPALHSDRVPSIGRISAVSSAAGSSRR